MTMRRARRSAVSTFLVFLAPRISASQEARPSADGYPERPIRFIVPYAPGGIADTVARLVSVKLSERLRQTALVDNRPGSGAVIGNELVARAAADGYTLLVGTTVLVQAPALQAKLPYDALRDFEPVAQLMSADSLLLVPASSPVTSLDGLVMLAKREVGKHNYGHYGNGTSSHLFGELLKRSGGSLDLVPVPFKGASPLINELMAGRIDTAFIDIGSSQSYVTSGRLRALASTGKRRPTLFPSVPTMAEAGFTGFDLSSWIGIFTPSKTSPIVIRKLSRELNAVIDLPDIRERLLGLGVEPVIGSPEDLAEMMRVDAPRWAELIRSAGIKAE